MEFLCWDTFQAVYEGVMAANHGWVGLVKLVYCAFWRVLARLFNTWDCQKQTHLVNTAAIGGVQDEKRCDPIFVTI